MAREPREVWEKRVARWRESGLTAKEFAGEVGVNANTLAHWAWRLDQAAAGSPKEATQARSTKTTPSVSFVEVVGAPRSDLRAEPDKSRLYAAFELVLAGGRTLRVPVDFEAEALRRLIVAVENA
jgi:transposase-like protein